jgi:hypothetical protein
MTVAEACLCTRRFRILCHDLHRRDGVGRLGRIVQVRSDHLVCHIVRHT